MSASTQVVNDVAASKAVSLRWIISGQDDLIWFIGSVLSSYALLFLYVGGWIPLFPMIAAWAILIDGPHVFGTFSRTYFDKAERKNRKRLLWGSLLFFAVGPIMVLAGMSGVFFFVAAIWAYYHLVKQHYGFMVLYKKKNNDLLKIDNALDRIFLLLAFTYPFVAFIERDPEAMARVPVLLHGVIPALSKMLLAATIMTGAVWLGRQIQRVATGLTLDIPKYLLLAAAIPMHWAVLLTPMPHKPIAIVAILTIYHNLQYHRLIWFHNRKYTSVKDARDKHGAAELISRNLVIFSAFALVYGILYQGPRQFIIGYEPEKALWMSLATAFLWGNAFIHYYLDSKIWRVRRDKSVGAALKME
jgi:hypothetical protein